MSTSSSIGSASRRDSACLSTLTNPQLLSRLETLVRESRCAEADLLVHLGEVDARRLYLDEAYSSMFDYCTSVLHFEEGVAYNRIHVARAVRLHPELLEALRGGELHLTGIRLLVPQLTRENARDWIRAARHRSANEIRALIADRQPRPDVPASIRHQFVDGSSEKAMRVSEASRSFEPAIVTRSADRSESCPVLPQATAPPPPDPAQRTRNEPLGGGRYCVKFTADPEFHQELMELRSLLRHQIPDGDLAAILKRAVRDLLVQVRKRKTADVAAPRAASAEPSARPSRHIPHAIQRKVWKRDGGRCTFMSKRGRRCATRDFLEFHHLEPWSLARTHSVAGISLRCRAHNQAAARNVFGERHMARFARPKAKNHIDADEDPAAPDPDQAGARSSSRDSFCSKTLSIQSPPACRPGA